MLSNIVDTHFVSYENLYKKFQNLLGRGTDCSTETNKEDNMLSARGSTTASEDGFLTPQSSVGDLMTLSPTRADESDLLTGTEFNSICDVTMVEVPTHDDNNILIDATSVDYLVKCADSNQNRNYIDRGRESLFIKFDPLYSKHKRATSGSTAASVTDSLECDVGYETGSTVSILTENNIDSVGSLSLHSRRDKPTLLVQPVVNGDMPKTCGSQTRSTPALVRSVSAILTPSQVVTDRLITLSGQNLTMPASPHFRSYTSQEVDRLQSLRQILQKQDQEALQLRQENRELRSILHETQNKNSYSTEILEAKVKKLTEENNNLNEKVNKLLKQLNDRTLSNKQMCIVMEEYEKTISSLIDDQQHEKILSKEFQDKLILERDEAVNHLASMETSFNDLLAKYEKCKQLIFEGKDREKIYEEKITEYEIGLKKYETLYENLKQVTSESLGKANETLDNMKKTHNIEITKLNATIKKHEITIASLQESLALKTRDNEELTTICDQLINDVR